MDTDQPLSIECQEIKDRLLQIAAELDTNNNQLAHDAEIAALREASRAAGCPMRIEWQSGGNQVVSDT